MGGAVAESAPRDDDDDNEETDEQVQEQHETPHQDDTHTQQQLLTPIPPDQQDDTHDEPPHQTSLADDLAAAATHKADGNDAFKMLRHAEAAQAYQRAIGLLEPHCDAHADAREALLPLHTNLAACHIRLELYDDAEVATTAALALDAHASVKALFRRGVARSRLGKLDGARSDLVAACRADPKNREARAELAAVTKAQQQQREEERVRLSKMFSGKSLYAEEERKKLEEAAEAARKKEADAAAEATREAELRVEWQAECERLSLEAAADDGTRAGSSDQAVGQAEVNEPPVSFEDFKKAREDARKEAEEAETKAAEERRARERHERQLEHARNSVVRIEGEEELGDGVRGYKKRADGSITSYFDRELDPAARALLEQSRAPKRINGSTEAVAPSL